MRIIHTTQTQTPCTFCTHVRGNNDPSGRFWSCAADNVMGEPFQRVNETEPSDYRGAPAKFTHEGVCPDFKIKPRCE